MEDPSPKPLKMVFKLGPKPDNAAVAEPVKPRYRVEPDHVHSPAPSNSSSVITRSEPTSDLRVTVNEPPTVISKHPVKSSVAAAATAVVEEPKSRNVESLKQSLRNAGAEKRDKEKAKAKDKKVDEHDYLDDDVDGVDDLMEDEECLATPKRGRRPFALSRFADPQQLAADVGRLSSENPTLFCATLCEFLKVLVKMDRFDIFGYPVTDEIAPGYSQIIRTPMDFGTMRRKVISRAYGSLSEFKADLNLLCSNAMTYNAPTTVFHKEARRLASFAKRVLRAQNFLLVSRKIDQRGTCNAILQRTAAAAGAEPHVPVLFAPRKQPLPTTAAAPTSGNKPQQTTPMLPGHIDPLTGMLQFGDSNDDDYDVEGNIQAMSEEELLDMVKKARSRLLLNGKLDDRTAVSSGSLSAGTEGASAKRARLAVASELQQNGTVGFDVHTCAGSAHASAYSRIFYAPTDPRCDAALIESIDRGVENLRSLAYANTYSYAPTYDSGGDCPLTPAQNAAWNRLVQRVRSTYADAKGDSSSDGSDSTGYEFARSMEWFVRGCVPYAVRYADELLDTLTHGQHSKTMNETMEFLTSYREVLDASRRPPTPPPPTPPPPPQPVAASAVEQLDVNDLVSILDGVEHQSSWLAALPVPASNTLVAPLPSQAPVQAPQLNLPAPAPSLEQEDEATLASRIMNELEELEMFL